MSYSTITFPASAPIWGFNAYSVLTDVVERSYQENQDAAGALVTPSNTVLLPTLISSFVLGTAGNLSLLLSNGSSLVLNNLAAGVVHRFPFRIARINATGTSATGIVGIG